MTDTFSGDVKRSYRSIRGSSVLARHIGEDYARQDKSFRFALPVFASLLIGGIALAVFRPEFTVQQMASDPLNMPRMEVSQVTAQVGQFARLSMGQLKIPTSSSLVLPVTPVAMPKLPISAATSVRDG